jgi:hypothetical protein
MNSIRQRLIAAGIAGLGAFVLVVTGAQAFPICVLYTPDNMEWYLFLCYLN